MAYDELVTQQDPDDEVKLDEGGPQSLTILSCCRSSPAA